MEIGKKLLDSIPWGEFTKGLVGVLFATGTSSAAAIFFPRINPKYWQDIWSFNLLAMVAASCLSYVFTQSNFGSTHKWPGALSGFLFTCFLIALLALSLKVLPVSAAAEAFWGRICFIGLFSSLSAILAWTYACVFSGGARPPPVRS
jgi:drug/metabolite transporter (DMT)-like permease